MQVLGMTRKNVFGLLFAIFCVSGNISCNKYLLSEKDKEEEKENIFIESFEGVSNVDLSNRNNWILTMNYYYIYDYTIDGKRIKSFPKDEPCYIPGSFITEDNSGSPWVGLGSGPLILLRHPAIIPNSYPEVRIIHHPHSSTKQPKKSYWPPIACLANI